MQQEECFSCFQTRRNSGAMVTGLEQVPVLRGQTREQLLPLPPVLNRERVFAEVEEQIDEVDEAADPKPASGSETEPIGLEMISRLRARTARVCPDVL